MTSSNELVRSPKDYVFSQWAKSGMVQVKMHFHPSWLPTIEEHGLNEEELIKTAIFVLSKHGFTVTSVGIKLRFYGHDSELTMHLGHVGHLRTRYRLGICILLGFDSEILEIEPEDFIETEPTLLLPSKGQGLLSSDPKTPLLTDKT